jgi:hypothetical protein
VGVVAVTEISRRALLAGAAVAGGGSAAAHLLGSAQTAEDATAWQSKIVTNVKDYGARGDGTNDDAGAINAAIAATRFGGTVWFPPGTYRVGSPIRLAQGLRYTASNEWGVTIEQAPGANLPAVAADAGYLDGKKSVSDGVTIEYLVIDGRKDVNHAGHGLVLMNWRAIVRSVKVLNTPEAGIVLSDLNIKGESYSGVAIENRIEDCTISFTNSYAVWIMDHDNSGKVTDGYLLNNVVEACDGPYGMRIDRAAGWFIENNHVYDSRHSAFFLDQVWCTFFGFNEVDTFGLSGIPGATFTGVMVDHLLVTGRPSVFIGNISATAQTHGPKSSFVHFHIIGNQPGTCRVTVVANVAHNDPHLGGSPIVGAGGATNSIGFMYEAQTGGELAVTEVANRSDGNFVPLSGRKAEGTSTSSRTRRLCRWWWPAATCSSAPVRPRWSDCRSERTEKC